MAMAMKIKTGNPLRKLVLLKLADNANDQGECWPSIPYLAATCEMAERSVQNHIKWLHEHGFLWVERRKSKNGGHQSNIYHLTLERRLRSPLEEDENDEPPSAENQGKNGAAQGAGSAGANGASLSEVPVQQIRQGLSFDSLGVAQPLHPEPIIKNLSLEPIPPYPPTTANSLSPTRTKPIGENRIGQSPIDTIASSIILKPITQSGRISLDDLLSVWTMALIWQLTTSWWETGYPMR